MKKCFLRICAITAMLIFLGCKDEKKASPEAMQHVEKTKKAPSNKMDSEVGEILGKAIDFAGGWKQWSAKKTLSYTKKVENYDSLGNKLREYSQLHQYQLRPKFKARISWEEDGVKFEMINNGQMARKLKNGEVLTGDDDINTAWNSSFGSHYVMCMPFKLADPGAILTYEGLDTLANNQVVHAIRTNYKKGAGSAGGMHTWWYYFDKDTYQPAANYLDYGEGYSYTKYESFTTENGIKINKQRNGYRTNKDRDLLFLSTVYTNEDIKFDMPFEENLFEIEK